MPAAALAKLAEFGTAPDSDLLNWKGVVWVVYIVGLHYSKLVLGPLMLHPLIFNTIQLSSLLGNRGRDLWGDRGRNG